MRRREKVMMKIINLTGKSNRKEGPRKKVKKEE